MDTCKFAESAVRFSSRRYLCHCCGSANTAYLQHYVLRRSLSTAPMYLCDDCGSISVDFAAVKKHYPVSNSQEAIEFHRKIIGRNQGWSELFLDAVTAKLAGSKQISTVIDIGCGSGILLGVASRRGLRAVGYEVDELAIEEARSVPGLEVIHDFFSRSSAGIPGALVCCIMVLEHLERPLELLAEIAAYCRQHGCAAFVSVPLLPADWDRFLEESVLAKGNPFFDNEEHVTHFSPGAFAKAWQREFDGAPETITTGGWRGYFNEAKP